MRQAAAKAHGHEVAGLPVLAPSGRLPLEALALEIAFEVRHAAMVDVPVGAREAPDLRIVRERRFHVLVHQHLQVHVERVAVGADNNVRAHARSAVDIPARIIQRHIGRVIAGGDADLPARRAHQFLGPTTFLHHQRQGRQ